jgi:hypothetical protein
MALPMVALPPLTELRRDFARKNKARSKMNASRVMVAPRAPVLVHVVDFSAYAAPGRYTSAS